MKTYLRTILPATIVLIASSSVWAQVNVALLDIGYIFKNHQGFKQQMDTMKADVALFEKELKAKQQGIQQRSRQLGTLKAGSQQYKDLEERTTKDLADLKVTMQLRRKKIMEDEAEIYMETYKQVMSAVSAFANSHNIQLVLRYDREANPSDTASPQDTLKIINRPVVFQSRLDISDSILGNVGGVARTNNPATQQK